jgi:hypothetical protein
VTAAALLVAHVGHWWVYPLYAVPVVIVLASIAFAVVRDRRDRR